MSQPSQPSQPSEPQKFDSLSGMDTMIWVWAACSSTIASMLFLVPAFYSLALHGLAIVGFFSILTGKSKALWPPFENVVATAQRILEAATAFAPLKHAPQTQRTNQPP